MKFLSRKNTYHLSRRALPSSGNGGNSTIVDGILIFQSQHDYRTAKQLGPHAHGSARATANIHEDRFVRHLVMTSHPAKELAEAARTSQPEDTPTPRRWQIVEKVATSRNLRAWSTNRSLLFQTNSGVVVVGSSGKVPCTFPTYAAHSIKVGIGSKRTITT